MEKRDGLLRWQYSLYPLGHRNRRNLILHVLTVPLFMAGTVLLLLALLSLTLWLVAAGLVAMVATVAVQGRGHARERERPVPFDGPFDVASRLFVEQWVTFPRYVISGGFARAWRGQ